MSEEGFKFNFVGDLVGGDETDERITNVVDDGTEAFVAVDESKFGSGFVEVIKDVVFDEIGERCRFVAVYGDAGVDFLETPSVFVEFTVESDVWREVGECFADVRTDVTMPEFAVAGLESAGVVEGTDTVDFWLSESWPNKFFLVLGVFMGKHRFHCSSGKNRVRNEDRLRCRLCNGRF